MTESLPAHDVTACLSRLTCPAVAEHLKALDLLAIPRCAANRAENGLPAGSGYPNPVPAEYCASAYCPRCQNLRVFYGEPPIEPNQWLNEEPVRPASDAFFEDDEQLRADALELIVEAARSCVLAPDIPNTQDAITISGDLARIIALADMLSALIKESVGARGSRLIVVDTGLRLASRMMYRNLDHIESAFVANAEIFGQFIAGQLRAQTGNPDAADH